MKKLIIPKSARIAWNTIEDLEVERDDQESIFLATFDDVPTANGAKYQVDYSYYNRGKYAAAPKFILNVYTCSVENYSDTVYHLDKSYDTLDGGIEDINHWLSVFDLTHSLANKIPKLNIFELEALGQKIKNSEGTEAETNALMALFDKSW